MQSNHRRLSHAVLFQPLTAESKKEKEEGPKLKDYRPSPILSSHPRR